MKIRLLEPFEQASTVSLKVDRFGVFPGDVVWRYGDFLGIRFRDDPADIAEIFGAGAPALRYRTSSYGARHPLAIPRVSTCIDLCRALAWLPAEVYVTASYDDLGPRSGRRACEHTAMSLVELYTAWGKPEKAAEWRAKLGGSLHSGS